VRCARLALLLALVVPAAPAQQEGPGQIVDAFHYALKAGKRDIALGFLAADALVFEEGRMNRSRSDYARRDLGQDIDFAATTKLTVSRRDIKVAGDVAWVLSQNHIEGHYRDRPVDLVADETVLLRRTAGKWRIVHMHWSFSQQGAATR
jgi:ketosteroid isomerase-like protein